jgi:hypothetical protein
MPFSPGITNINQLLTDQPVTSSVTVATVQNSTADTFSIALAAGKRIFWEVYGCFSVGATGGFRFQATNSQTSSLYTAEYTVSQDTTPSIFYVALVAQAAFVNASAVAETYSLEARGQITQGATGGLFSFQFAQNTSDALPITMKAGTIIRICQY